MQVRCWRSIWSLPVCLALVAGATAAVPIRDGRIIPPVFVKSQIEKSPVEKITLDNIRVEEVFGRKPAPEFVSLPSIRQERIRPRVPTVQPIQSFSRPPVYNRGNYYYYPGGGYQYNAKYNQSYTTYQPTLDDYRHLGR